MFTHFKSVSKKQKAILKRTLKWAQTMLFAHLKYVSKSESYVETYNKTSYIKLVRSPKVWFVKYAKKIAPSFEGEDGIIYPKKSDDKFFKKYCNQIKNEKGVRSHSYKLKTK